MSLKNVANRKSESHREWVTTKDGRRVRNIAYKGREKKPGTERLRPDVREKPDAVSAETSRVYGHAGVEIGHLHNSFSYAMDPIEEFYYTSPQGRMELARRAEHRDSIGRTSNNPYAELAAKLDAGYRPPTPELPDDLDAQIRAGKKSIENARPDDSVLVHRRRGGLDVDTGLERARRHFLTEKSAEWMSRLTTGEQEAISRLTANGTVVMRRELGFTDNEPNWENEPPLKDDVLSAMAKAPRFDKPVLIYRGTCPEDIDDSVRSAIPQSATTNPRQAMTFEKGAVLEIEQVTAAVPGNVGAWGVKEEEVFTNPTSDYVETGRRTVDPHAGSNLEGKFPVIVVTLREVPRDV